MAEASSVMEIPVTKAKRGISIDTNDLPLEVFHEVVRLGLKELINRGMSKIAIKDLEGSELDAAHNAAFAKAEENVKAILAGEIKYSTGAKKASKVPTEVKTEALRLAKAAINQQIKDDGGKVSHYAKSDITKWAKELLEADGSYIVMAEDSLAKRKATPVKISLSGLKPSEKLVKAAEEKKAKKGKPISAKQAGMPAPRVKPAARPTAH
jgi:hypothetical protein